MVGTQVGESARPGLRLALSPWLASLTDCPGPTNVLTVVHGTGEHFCVTAPSVQECPAAAHQGQCGVVFDGWLYNRRALRTDLRLSPDSSDAVLALHAYLRWGDGALQHLEGIFALCIWDGRTGTLLCARDPLGVYPLFYVRLPGVWLFSTSSDALLADPRVPKTVNRVALATYLLRQHRDIEETHFSDVRRIPPGHVLKAHGTNAGVTRYWTPLADDGVRWVQEEELEQFPEILKRAIGRCVEIGRPGIYLSGGLDSGTLATIGADYARERGLPSAHAVSLVHADREVDEEQTQRAIAASLGLSQSLVPFDGANDGDEVFLRSLRANCTWPHPFAVGLSPLHLTLGDRAREAGCDVVLSGEGGDEWLTLHWCLAADFARRLDMSNLLRLWRTADELNSKGWHKAARRVLVEDGIRPLVRDRMRASLRRAAPALLRARRRGSALSIPSWLAPDPEIRAAIRERSERASEKAARSFYEREIFRDILDQPLTVLYKEDTFESSRRTGILMLEPFYDPEVIKFLVRTPPWFRAAGGRYKGLLRQLLHQRHPRLGYDRQRKPYATNLLARKVFKGAEWAWPALGGARTLGDLGVVDAAQVHALVVRILESGAVNETQRLWMMLCAETWARARLDSSSVARTLLH